MTTKPKSKTLVDALSELEKGLENSNKVIICDLAKQFAENLPFNYHTYLPYKKILKCSITLQTNKLYTGTYWLEDEA